MMASCVMFGMLAGTTMGETTSVVTVDASTTQPISPFIYGANNPDWKRIDVPFTLARLGGNRLTAYNWENNASNAGADWHHQNDGYLGRSDEAGWTVRSFLEEAQRHQAAAILTVQTIGHVAADKNPPGDVNRSANYLKTRFVPSYAKKPGANYIYPPDLKDHAVYEDEQVWWIEKIKSSATSVWYMLDNEPDLWSWTHARIQTHKPTYAEIIANNLEYGSAVKAVAPKALVFGPASYGWKGFQTFQDAPDAKGRNFLDVYLEAMKQGEAQQGRRILDVLDVHWYPEAKGGGVRVTDNAEGNAALEEARIQAPRSLWDPEYIEESWIAESLGKKPIQLVPSLLSKIAAHYPGTKLSVSEYNFGGGSHPSGMVAEADVLGIFGRYGVFAACNWGVSRKDVAMLAGYRAYLNYDGQGGKYGSMGLKVTGESPAKNSIYASLDAADGKRMTFVAINKTGQDQKVELKTEHFMPTRAHAFTFKEGFYEQPVTSDPIIAPKGEGVTVSLPPYSVTTVALER